MYQLLRYYNYSTHYCLRLLLDQKYRLNSRIPFAYADTMQPAYARMMRSGTAVPRVYSRVIVVTVDIGRDCRVER